MGAVLPQVLPAAHQPLAGPGPGRIGAHPAGRHPPAELSPGGAVPSPPQPAGPRTRPQDGQRLAQPAGLPAARHERVPAAGHRRVRRPQLQGAGGASGARQAVQARGVRGDRRGHAGGGGLVGGAGGVGDDGGGRGPARGDNARTQAVWRGVQRPVHGRRRGQHGQDQRGRGGRPVRAHRHHPRHRHPGQRPGARADRAAEREPVDPRGQGPADLRGQGHGRADQAQRLPGGGEGCAHQGDERAAHDLAAVPRLLRGGGGGVQPAAAFEPAEDHGPGDQAAAAHEPLGVLGLAHGQRLEPGGVPAVGPGDRGAVAAADRAHGGAQLRGAGRQHLLQQGPGTPGRRAGAGGLRPACTGERADLERARPAGVLRLLREEPDQLLPGGHGGAGRGGAGAAAVADQAQPAGRDRPGTARGDRGAAGGNHPDGAPARAHHRPRAAGGAHAGAGGVRGAARRPRQVPVVAGSGATGAGRGGPGRAGGAVF